MPSIVNPYQQKQGNQPVLGSGSAIQRKNRPNYIIVKYTKEALRQRQGVLGQIAPKQKIGGLTEEEVEIGEEAQKTVQGVTCEHNLKNV